MAAADGVSVATSNGSSTFSALSADGRFVSFQSLATNLVAGDANGFLYAFVRDRGAGFDPAAVPADRKGVAESIEGRMERAGGRATIVTSPGKGAEVELHLPRGSS